MQVGCLKEKSIEYTQCVYLYIILAYSICRGRCFSFLLTNPREKLTAVVLQFNFHLFRGQHLTLAILVVYEGLSDYECLRHPYCTDRDILFLMCTCCTYSTYLSTCKWTKASAKCPTCK